MTTATQRRDCAPLRRVRRAWVTSTSAASPVEDFERLQAKRRAAAEQGIDFWCRLWILCQLISIPSLVGGVHLVRSGGLARLLGDTDAATAVLFVWLASLATAGRAAALTIGDWRTVSRRWRWLGLAPWIVLVAELGVAATVVLLGL